jgi:hypothetical protein
MDVNNDSVLDVAAAITPYSPEQVIMIDGSTQNSIWTKSMDIASNVHGLAHGDLDGDGIPDLVVPGSSNDKKVHALDGENGNELWTFQSAGEINTVAVEDINLDNELDVIAGSDDQNVYVIKGGNGTCWWNFSTADDVMHIQIGDISGDEKPNIACVTFGSDGIAYAFKSYADPVNYSPYQPSNPSPENNAMYVDPNADLSWTGGDPNPGDTVTYDIYFGTSTSPSKIVSNQSGTSYDPGTLGYNTTYYWKITSWDEENLSSEGPEWSFIVEGPNNSPYEPNDPDPEDGETDVDVDYDISWSGGDPDPGDTVTYDVYFEADDSSPDVLVSSHQSGTTYDPGTMDGNTQYYWQIVAWDNHGNYTLGSIWDFITENLPPNTPSNPSPNDGAEDVDVNADLSWTCSDPEDDDLTYNVYFEDNDPTPDELVSENQTDTTYDPGTMEFNTDYYWMIVAWDEYGASTSGPVWSFTTGEFPNEPPNEPSNPSPENESIDISIDTILSWTCSDPDGDPLVYDVFLEKGDSTPDVLVSDDQTSTNYDPEGLEYNTIYYWKIVAKDNHSATTDGPVWSFTTEEAVPDLNCGGSLSWADVPVDTIVTGSFYIENIGDPTSLLDWEIENYPDWGTWTITPMEGYDLEPELEPFVVEVSVRAPDEKNEEFTGEVKIVNQDNSSDFCIIDVSLATPKNKPFIHNFPILSWLFERFPHLFPILRQILAHLEKI